MKRSLTKLTSFTVVAAVFTLLCATPVSLRAATNTVTSTADSGSGTLRAALNAAGNGDTIKFSVSGTITLTSGQLTVPNNVTILGPGAGSLTVSGNGASRVLNVAGSEVTIRGLTIANGYAAGMDGAGIYAGGAAGSVVTIRDCVVTNNYTTTDGGGIYNSAEVTMLISNCVVSGNIAASWGGGIYNHGESGRTALMTIDACTISANSANAGGGILNWGWAGSATLTVAHSSISSNAVSAKGGGIYNVGESVGTAALIVNASTLSGNSAHDGGGIYNDGTSGNATLTVTSSMLSDNLAQSGGGISNDGSTGTVTLTISTSTFSDNMASNTWGGAVLNTATWGYAWMTVDASTFSGNWADIGGGAILSYGPGGNATLEINASTFSGNSSSAGGAIANDGEGAGNAVLTVNASTFSGNSGQLGGGIYTADATVEIGDTILNAGATGANIYVGLSGTITSYGYNLSSDSGGGYLTSATDLINTDPRLGPLQDNGGPTPTHALLAGSPAIDQGNRAAVPVMVSNTDQRGYPRPSDIPAVANAVGGDGSDIGAFEVMSSLTVTKLQLKVSLNPARTNLDTCKLTATLDLGPGYNPSNVVANVNVGGAQASFTLNAKGIGVTATNSCKCSYNKKTGLWTVIASLNKGTWAAPWATHGLTNTTTPKTGTTVSLPVILQFGNQAFAQDKSLRYTAAAGKSGTAR
ncbi:MAG TPA: choice-of-anchor Q domain-containing protein [Verrucomicrobiae bacterium]|nr:choice-of-anchor Q domain-containing protein [Verrucomicrobiae bacterium]